MFHGEQPKRKILIWGKTYPELSLKYFETVCTGGVLEDGSPIRLYPIPLRYLEERFHKYQWISAHICRNEKDPRPESYRIDCESIECGTQIPATSDEWGKRAEVIFRSPTWQFDSVEALKDAQKKMNGSLGIVTPREILCISVVPRPKGDVESFEQKLDRIRQRIQADRAQLMLFDDAREALPTEMKSLDFVDRRIKVKWRCSSSECPAHEMQVLDWEVTELHRREGDEKALQKMHEICDLSTHAVRFFLGNLFLHPAAFTIVGIWYPKRAEGRLFK